MLKTALRVVLGTATVFALVLTAQAQEKKDKADEKKEVTLKGVFHCTKCALGETDDCGNSIKVKEDGKDVVYYLLDKGKAEKYHGTFCRGPQKGSVTGVVSEKEKKKFITPGKDGVKFD